MKNDLFLSKVFQRLKDLIYLVIQILFTFFVIYFLAKNISFGWEKANKIIYQIKPLGLSFSIIFAMIGFFLQGIVWKNLVRKSEKKKIRTLAILNAFNSSLLLRYIPGNLWSYLAKLKLHKELGMRRAKVLYLSIIEIFINVASGALLFFLSLFFWHDKTVFFRENRAISIISIALLVLIFLSPWLWKLFFTYVIKKKQFHFSSNKIKSSIPLFFFIYIFSWISYGLSLYALLLGTIDLSVNSIIITVGATTSSFILGFLSFVTPSGLGVRESVLTFVLGGILTSGVAALFAVIFRLVVTVSEILIFALIFFLNKITKIKVNNTL